MTDQRLIDPDEEQHPTAKLTSKDSSPKVAGVILAAGSSRRFGSQPKLAAEFIGKSLLRRSCETATASSLHRVIVVLGADSERLRSHTENTAKDLVIVYNADYDLGQSTSVLRGLKAAIEQREPIDGVVFLAADQPLLTPGHIDAVLAAATASLAADEATAVQAVDENGRPGTPVFFPRSLFHDLKAVLTKSGGDEGGRKLLRSLPPERVVTVTIAAAALADIDSPKDLEVMETQYKTSTQTR